ncbi:hypothetical protein HanXRQr2_Chr04g0149331 [Helianthus annuus]|uniref:Uncharacterized protein n=1 Tax=Helianthus annuus TaxID=4232 RepID=A0A9K3J5F4_HELAN|nr:hypothetical protein HanXRQr2_Chr04g0149331 [Helianthus annuus]KAJ0929953.1 hypothetical protein HanPSC8_Chr04g0143761 [Helianthus annuus]
MLFIINKSSSKQEFIGKYRKQEIKEHREIKPEQSSLSRSKLQPNDSRKLKHSKILKISFKIRPRVS